MQAAHDQSLGAARAAPGAGAMLRAAREAAGMSREDLAARTRLETKIIQALESEDYGSMAAAAFVKGYIRSLAKELKVDPAPILTQYTHHTATDDPALADFKTRGPAQITSSSALMRSVSIALVLIVTVLIALWWRRYYQTDAASPAAMAQLAAEAALEVTGDRGTPLPYPYTIVDHSSSPLEPVNSWRRQTDGSAPPQSEPVIDLQAVVAAPSEVPVVEPLEPVAVSSNTGELVLSGDGESWIEVSDFAGKRLYFGLIKPGQQIGVSGKPPYDLVIGNSPMVKLSYRGQSIDVQARAVNGVARFSVGEFQ